MSSLLKLPDTYIKLKRVVIVNNRKYFVYYGLLEGQNYKFVVPYYWNFVDNKVVKKICIGDPDYNKW